MIIAEFAPISDLAEDTARSAGEAAAAQLLDAASIWILDGVVWTTRAVFSFFDAATTPNLAAGWFAGPDGPYAMTLQLGALLFVGFALLAITQGALAGDVGGTLRTLTVRAPAGVLAMVATIGVTQAAIVAVDAVAAGFLQRFSADSEAVAYALEAALPSPGLSPSFAVVALGVVAVLAGLVVMAELVVRSALLYLIVALAPLVFAAQVWPMLRGASRRLLELLAALVLSKLAIAIALAVAGAAISSPLHTPDGGGASAAATVGVLLTAAAAFGVAAFSPFLIHRLLPLTEAATVAQGTTGGPVRAGRSILATTTTAAAASHRLGALAGGTSPTGPRTAAPAAARVAETHATTGGTR
jgi:hypothetical protein